MWDILIGMVQVRIRANAPVLGLRRGEVVEVELTGFVERIAASGYVSLLTQRPGQPGGRPGASSALRPRQAAGAVRRA